MSNWVAISIFLIIYLFISVQRFPFIKIDRPAGVFTGVTLLIYAGIITLEEGYGFIDWDVITFLLGMMVTVSYLQNSGFFALAAQFIVKKCKSPKSLLAGITISSALLSALFVNDTVCLLFAPVIISAALALKTNPIPYLAALTLSSNIGSALTITGNPQNMYIGVTTGISFVKFAAMTVVPVALSLIAAYIVLRIVYKKYMKPFEKTEHKIEYIQIDKPLMIKSLLSLLITIALFISGVGYAVAALTGATVIILLAGIKPAKVFNKIDWPILLFFAGLFIVMGAFEKMGYASALINAAESYTELDNIYSIGIFSAIAALLSNAVSNVPAVILMMPIAENSHTSAVLLSLASTCAGNLTLVGSVANLIVAERAESCGVSFSFTEHLKAGIPVTVISCVIAAIWIYIIS